MSEIVRVLRVVDTRDWQEIADGEFAPVPGSGDPRPCDRCGRDHEVHVHVALRDGSQAIIGVSCSKKDAMLPELKRAVARQKTLDRTRAEIRAADARRLRAEEAFRRAHELAVPELSIGAEWAYRGDARMKLQPWLRPDDLHTSTLRMWRDKRYRELSGLPMEPAHYRHRVEQLEQHLAKLERRRAG